MSHKNRRKLEFRSILDKLNGDSYFSNERSLVINGDSLDYLRKLPDASISLILTDPPYHSTKKDNITNDKAFNSDNDFLDWINLFVIEWRRILRPNGSLFFFCSSTMSAKLELLLSNNFNVLSHIVWTKPNDPGFDGWKGKMKKEALRQWYPHSERVLFAEPAIEGNFKRSWFGQFLREKRILCCLSGHELTHRTGAFGKVNHGGAVSNWETGRNIPSMEQYSKICTAFIETGKLSEMPDYEDVVRKFEVTSDVEFTDVWNFNSVRPYSGKHPAEKPINLLEHCINATTFEDDIILDCFAGSGSTAIAALNLNRFSISIEIEKEWVEKIKTRLINHAPLRKINGESATKLNIMKISQNQLITMQKSLFE